MTLQRTKLTDIQLVPINVGTVYTNPTDTTTYIRSVILHNTHSSEVTVNLHNVPNNAGAIGTATTSNRFFSRVLKNTETIEFGFYYPITLIDANESLQASSSVNNVVTILISGDKDA
jgi:hypothetical protein